MANYNLQDKTKCLGGGTVFRVPEIMTIPCTHEAMRLAVGKP
jgi:hypothetical protein